MPQQKIPVVMSFSGLDPSGGAGLQADIEAIASMGCHTAPIATALTVQDSRDVSDCRPVDADQILRQARAVLADMPVAAIKTGLLASTGAVQAIHDILTEHPDIPLILDPVLKAGGGGALTSEEVRAAAVDLLLPQATITTPNSDEALALASGAHDLHDAARAIMAGGTQYVLITGTHLDNDEVINTLYHDMRRVEAFYWQRLPHAYHGSGCTLASAIAGLLAQGLDPFTAVHEAQEYTWEALKNGYRIGLGQHLPNRLFWARDDDPA